MLLGRRKGPVVFVRGSRYTNGVQKQKGRKEKCTTKEKGGREREVRSER